MVNLNKIVRKKLGEILVEEGLLREEQIQEALKTQKETGGLLGEVLVKLAFLREEDIARAIVKQFGLPYIDASKYNINVEALEVVPRKMMWDNQFIILDKIGQVMTVAVSGLMSPAIFEDIEKTTGSQLFLYVSTGTQVRQALEKHAPRDVS